MDNYLDINSGEVPMMPAVALGRTKIKTNIGWNVKIRIEEAVNLMLSWYYEHNISAIDSHINTSKLSEISDDVVYICWSQIKLGQAK